MISGLEQILFFFGLKVFLFLLVALEQIIYLTFHFCLI